MVGGGVQPLRLQRVQLRVEERLADPDLEYEEPAPQRLLQIHHLGQGVYIIFSSFPILLFSFYNLFV